MIIAITNQKGGCGKTTTAINLAASLAAMKQRTLLIDLDPQTHASLGLGIRSETLECSIYNVLTERQEQHQFLENAITSFSDNLDVAPGHVLLSTIEQEFVEKDHAVGKLKSVLENLVFPYQYVVIDCPPSLGFLTFNALYAADLAIVPLELGSFALYGVAKLLSMVELLRVKLNHAPKVFALATMIDLRSRFSKEMLNKMRDSFRDNFFETMIRMNIACRESQQLGVPIRFHQETSRAAEDYMSLARELMARCTDQIAWSEIDEFSKMAQGRVREFQVAAPSADTVHLVGDFNGWRIDESSRLWGKGRGSWCKRILLKPGRYRYKFVVDGKWVPDPINNLAEPNPYGGIDSIVEIY